MEKRHEDKKLHATETKDDEAALDPVMTCPERPHHKERVGQVCPACDTPIPGGGAYGPEDYARYFGSPVVVPPFQPLFPGHDEYREQNRIAWEKYVELNKLREQALFDLADAKAARNAIKRGSRFIDASGQLVDDPTAGVRGARANMSIEELEEQFQKLEDATAAHLRSIIKMDQHAAARHRATILAESVPPSDGPSLLERAGALLRGS